VKNLKDGISCTPTLADKNVKENMYIKKL
jgi:hypothetical protein